MDAEIEVKLHIYDTFASTSRAPTASSTAQALGLDEKIVRAAFAGLHKKRLLVPEPDDPSRIRMAPPFSGVPTPHQVDVAGRIYFANCAWDSFGIAAALHRDADITSRCMDCDARLSLRIEGQKPRPDGLLFHVAVPAALWWKDIIFT